MQNSCVCDRYTPEGVESQAKRGLISLKGWFPDRLSGVPGSGGAGGPSVGA